MDLTHVLAQVLGTRPTTRPNACARLSDVGRVAQTCTSLADAARQCIDPLVDERGRTRLRPDAEKHCGGCTVFGLVWPLDECFSMVRGDGGQSVRTWRKQLSIPL